MYQVSVEEYRDTYRIVDQERYTALFIDLQSVTMNTSPLPPSPRLVKIKLV